MTGRKPSLLAKSILARLANEAGRRGASPQALLSQFARERLLYRLGNLPEGRRFVLKGAMLHTLWGLGMHRATRDMDLLGRGIISPEVLAGVFRGACIGGGGEDGVTFHEESIRTEGIRTGAEYGGFRVRLEGNLGRAELPVQVDVVVGEAVVPPPRIVTYPSLLDLPAPRIAAYPKEAVVAEKLHAVLTLGRASTRVKDIFDLWILSRHSGFEGRILGRAVAATFRRRRTPLPGPPSSMLATSLPADPARLRLWNAFLLRTGADAVQLEETMEDLAGFLVPLLQDPAISREGIWRPGGPWRREGPSLP